MSNTFKTIPTFSVGNVGEGFTEYKEIPSFSEVQGTVAEPSTVEDTPIPVASRELPATEQYGIAETAYLQLRHSNLTAALYNTYALWDMDDPTYTLNRAKKDVDAIINSDSTLTPEERLYLWDNANSTQAVAFAYQHIKDVRKANEAFSQNPVTGFVSGLLDPAEALVGAATSGVSRGLGVAGRVALGGTVGGVSGAVYASNQPSESDALLTQIAIGGLANVIGANGASKLKPKKLPNSAYKPSLLGLPEGARDIADKIGGGVKKLVSFYDELSLSSEEKARDLFGFTTDPTTGRTSASMRAKSYMSQLSTPLHALELKLRETGVVPTFKKRVSSLFRKADPVERETIMKNQQNAIAWLHSMHDWTSKMAKVSEASRILNDKILELEQQFPTLKGKISPIQYIKAKDVEAMDAVRLNAYIQAISKKQEEINATLRAERAKNTQNSRPNAQQVKLTNEQLKAIQDDLEVPDDIYVPLAKPENVDSLPAEYRDIVKAYIESGMGRETGNMINNQSTLNKVVVSPYYMHGEFSIERIDNLCKLHGYPAVAKMFGKQLLDKIRNKVQDDWVDDLDPEVLGMWFLHTQIKGKAGYAEMDHYIQGMFGKLSEELANKLMQASGIHRILGADEHANILSLIRKVTDAERVSLEGAMASSSILKHRTYWDYFTPTAEGIRIADCVAPDIMANAERNALKTASACSMSQVAYTGIDGAVKYLNTPTAIREYFNMMYDDVLRKTESSQEADAVTKYAYDLSMGNAIGDPVGDGYRIFSNIANSMFLTLSGLYNLVDFANAAKTFTIKEAIKNTVPALKRGMNFDLRELTNRDILELQDLLRVDTMNEGRFRSVITRTPEDLYELRDGLANDVEWLAQGIRFLNGQEYVRRAQVNLVSRLFQQRLTRAIDGIADDVEYFKSIGITDGILDSIREQHKKYGWVMSKWDNQALAGHVRTIGKTTLDDTVLSLRNGELPRFMSGAVGKVAFAYQSFIWAAHNKLARKYYNQEGIAGVATLLAMQLPSAILVAMLANVIKGRDPEEDLMTSVSTSMSGLGLMSIPITAFSRGAVGGTSPALAVPSNVVQILSGDMDVFKALSVTPMLSTFPVSKALLSALSNEYQD